MSELCLSDEKEVKYPEWSKIATHCIIGDPNGDPGGISFRLYDFLSKANTMLNRVGEELDSKQTITSLIFAYKLQYPCRKLYSTHFL